jgi:hypothetical protein
MLRDESRKETSVPSMRSRRVVFAGYAGVILAAVLVAATTFFISRQAGGGPAAGAQRPPAGDAPLAGPNDTPEPGAVVDTTKPAWNVPYENAERLKPRFDQVINGIAVGPTVDDPGVRDCSPGEAVSVTDFATAQGSPLRIVPSYLPNSVIEGRHEASSCRGKVVNHVVEYEIPAAAGADAKIASGQVRWDEIEHGGKLTIFRSLSIGPVYRTSNYAADRWRSATVLGLPAAVAEPILPMGLGRSAIVSWDSKTGVRTVVTGSSRKLDELVRVAEGLR